LQISEPWNNGACCLIEKVASQNFNILSLKSQIENLEAKYDSLWQEFRSLHNEVEEIEELHKMKDRFYEAKKMEMKEFKEMVKFVMKCEFEVQSLRNAVNEVTVKSSTSYNFSVSFCLY
jgi:chromosome segregation ATPase